MCDNKFCVIINLLLLENDFRHFKIRRTETLKNRVEANSDSDAGFRETSLSRCMHRRVFQRVCHHSVSPAERLLLLFFPLSSISRFLSDVLRFFPVFPFLCVSRRILQDSRVAQTRTDANVSCFPLSNFLSRAFSPSLSVLVRSYSALPLSSSCNSYLNSMWFSRDPRGILPPMFRLLKLLEMLVCLNISRATRSCSIRRETLRRIYKSFFLRFSVLWFSALIKLCARWSSWIPTRIRESFYLEKRKRLLCFLVYKIHSIHWQSSFLIFHSPGDPKWSLSHNFTKFRNRSVKEKRHSRHLSKDLYFSYWNLE